MNLDPEKSAGAPVPADPGFRWLVRLEAIGPGGVTLSALAKPSECAALAARYGIRSVASLGATAELWRKGSGAGARVQIVADVVQSCIVTLEPVQGHIDQTFEVDFLPREGAQPAETAGANGRAREGGDFEPIIGGTLDLGAVACEYLSLAIDPYPRKPGAEFAAAEYGGAGSRGGEKVDSAGRSPFAGLGGLISEGKGKA